MHGLAVSTDGQMSPGLVTLQGLGFMVLNLVWVMGPGFSRV
jgi:hypothetical protein